MYGLAIDVGNTKVHAQLRNERHLTLWDWSAATATFSSHVQIIEEAFWVAKRTANREPDFVGIGFGYPVDPKTGLAKLTLATHLTDSITVAQVRALLHGLPVFHFNDVEAATHALDFAYLTASHTALTPVKQPGDGTSVLIEIGTGVGVACRLPGGQVLSSEAMRIHAGDGVPYGLKLCGSEGFHRLVAELAADGARLPDRIQRALESDQELGPLMTLGIATDDWPVFTRPARDRYAICLGEFLGMLQLAFNASTLFIGGSVGRAPGFMQRIVSADAFWQGFAKKDALRNMNDMPIVLVNDADATVKGVYIAAWRAMNGQ